MTTADLEIRTPMPSTQTLLQFESVRNRQLLSNHWLQTRLRLEPEWEASREAAKLKLKNLADLWKRELPRIPHYNESQLEHALIQPVFEELGWELLPQVRVDGRKPDYALFANDQDKDTAIRCDRNSPDFWTTAKVVADAKAWGVSLDRPTGTGSSREFPPQQIEWYLDRTRCEFGILTNGAVWRLIPRSRAPHQPRYQTFVECDLERLLTDYCAATTMVAQESLLEEFQYFDLLFGPNGFRAAATHAPLLERAITGSSAYTLSAGEGLRDRAYEALRLSIEGFLEFAPNALSAASDLDECRTESFVLLYRLLFVMFAEDRGLLPYGKNRLYTDNRSLGRYRDELASRLNRIAAGTEPDFDKTSTNIWDDLCSLFDLVDAGNRRYGVTEYNGGLFDHARNPFLNTKKLSDFYLARVIDQLGRAADPEHPDAGLFRVDYRDLAIQHLGSIYEALLELRPKFATEKTRVASRRVQGELQECYVPISETVPSGWTLTGQEYDRGAVYLETRKGERRATGSYYTPDHIVEYITDATLGPICSRISDTLEQEIAEVGEKLRTASTEDKPAIQSELDRLATDFDERALSLRILDPSMGSGHFLLRAAETLAVEIASNPRTGDIRAAEMHEGESSIAYWKRQVVEHCLYGVDLNPLAVELAKLALWLDTTAVDQPLSFLDHHLRHGNSLVGGAVGALGGLVSNTDLPVFVSMCRRNIDDKVPGLVAPLLQIVATRSDTAAEVKKKEQLFHDFEKASSPLRALADLRCSAFSPRSELTASNYQDAIEAISQPRKFASIRTNDWFEKAEQVAREEFGECFHWEIEFPEVFYNAEGKRIDAGFDAIIGNPPYDVLSEQEVGRDLRALKRCIELEPTYHRSQGGKNNLYKLFVCRCVELLAPGGLLGLITPMAILGDQQATNIRKLLLDTGRFLSIDAFPQKDDRRQRVFADAKLSTAVFVARRESEADTHSQPFTARVHPGRTIETTSPQLTLSSQELSGYDPANLVIISCDQQDWDLAKGLYSSGRMVRLGTLCTSHQGEINETTDRAYLSTSSTTDPLVLRGSNICLYKVRDASQGTPLYVDAARIVADASGGSRVHHTVRPRVGFQRSSPQNNFRRIVAAIVPAGEFCFDTVSYVPEGSSKLSLELLLGLLNSQLLDWYFRLGSTNSKVNEYQFSNLPCPDFRPTRTASDDADSVAATHHIKAGNLHDAYAALTHLTQGAPPFSPAIVDAIIAAVQEIIQIEDTRGSIARTERSALATKAQPYQDFIDQVLFDLAGFTTAQIHGLRSRLATML